MRRGYRVVEGLECNQKREAKQAALLMKSRYFSNKKKEKKKRTIVTDRAAVEISIEKMTSLLVLFHWLVVGRGLCSFALWSFRCSSVFLPCGSRGPFLSFKQIALRPRHLQWRRLASSASRRRCSVSGIGLEIFRESWRIAGSLVELEMLMGR